MATSFTVYNFYKINLEANNFENIINNKIINKDSETFLKDIYSSKKMILLIKI